MVILWVFDLAARSAEKLVGLMAAMKAADSVVKWAAAKDENLVAETAASWVDGSANLKGEHWVALMAEMLDV